MHATGLPSPTVIAMQMRETWERLADVWNQRLDLSENRPDPYSTVALDALPLSDQMRILDIGCGPGVGSIQLAERAGPNARITGIDISPAMIAHARDRVRAAIMRGHITPTNVTLRAADAAHDDLGADHDVVYSRFGVMFFDEPDKAFTNLANALAPHGRLSFVAWADAADNPWMTVPNEAAAAALGVEIAPADPEAPGPFSLADREATVALLTATGFTDVRVLEVTQPRHYPHATGRQEIALAIQTGPVGAAYAQASPDQRSAAVDAIMAALERYRDPGPTGGWSIPAHARVFLARKA